MSYIRIVPDEHWKIINEYIEGLGALVLVPENQLAKLPKEQQEMIRDADHNDIDYNFGGDADVWIDVLRPGSYCADRITEVLNHQKEQA